MVEPMTLQEAVEVHGSQRAAADALGMPISTFRYKLKKEGVPPVDGATRVWKEGEDTASVVCYAEKAPRNDREMVQYAGVDETVWRVKKWSCGAWHTTLKTGLRGGESIHKPLNYCIRAEFERILPKCVRESVDRVFERLESRSPKWRKPPAWAKPRGQGLMVYSLYDVHFGKLAWGRETGFSDYDLDITAQLYRDSFERLIERSQGWPVDRILLPFGHDFMHIDSNRNDTTKGTVVDTDGRFAKILETAEMAVVDLVERLSAIAPVDVVLVQGNHDFHASYALSRILNAWFRNNEQVTVDAGPNPMKKYQYHKCLFSLVHGDSIGKSRVKELPNAMSLYHRDEWSEAKCCEIHMGHNHAQRGLMAPGYDEQAGVMMRWLPSLSATDFWHGRNLFIGNRRTAETLWYGPEEFLGCVMA